MTNETARREIEFLDYYLQNHTNDYSEESHMAMMMAIKALEKQPCEDCISRTEALDAIEKEKQGWEGSERYAIDECHTRIAELPSVTPKPDVLDKIRAKIEQLRLHKAQFITSDNKVCIDSQEVLKIIDKYKAESEDEE